MSLDLNRDVGSLIVASSASIWDDFQRSVQGLKYRDRTGTNVPIRVRFGRTFETTGIDFAVKNQRKLNAQV